MDWAKVLFTLLVFPGFLGLISLSFFMDWVDRILYAHMQGRYGPLYTGKYGFLQPLADFIKLLSKEDITPKQANSFMFNVLPLVSFAAVSTAAFLLPIGYKTNFNSFPGDILVVLYLLSLPTLVYFLVGWHSANFFSIYGGVRAITQFFSYEVPFLLAMLTPAILTNKWEIMKISQVESLHPFYLIIYALAFVVAIIGLQAKLERVPFDIPEAETEIVGGFLTEYSGKKLALFHLTHEMMLLIGSALVAGVFLGGFGSGVMSLFYFILKTLLIVFILSIIRAGSARMRIDQAIEFSWKYLSFLIFLQVFLIIIFKGFSLL